MRLRGRILLHLNMVSMESVGKDIFLCRSILLEEEPTLTAILSMAQRIFGSVSTEGAFAIAGIHSKFPVLDSC